MANINFTAELDNDSEYADWNAANEARHDADQQEAEARDCHFARLLNRATPMHRATIDGVLCVGWTGCVAHSYVPFDTAVSIWRGLMSVWA